MVGGEAETAKSRFTRSAKAVRLWCQRHRYLPLVQQHSALCQKLRGHFGYYGITGNHAALARFRWEVRRPPLPAGSVVVGEVPAVAGPLPTASAKSGAQRLPSQSEARDWRSRMREICTSGSAGGPGGAIPRGYPTISSAAGQGAPFIIDGNHYVVEVMPPPIRDSHVLVSSPLPHFCENTCLTKKHLQFCETNSEINPP